MRIRRLELKAFGPFRERVLDLTPDGPGLHIIFGSNEAGKSSALRALKALLFGFPERTADNFLFPNDQLLVGGTLEDGRGEKLVFFRRKKRKADLLDEQGNPLDPGRLSPFLHSMPLEIFESLYGINHEILLRGGEDILAQRGEVGQALFAAGAGISSLREILGSLEAEAEEIFKPRGAKQHINLALKEYAALDREVKQLSLSGRTWLEHRNRLEALRAEQERLDREFNEKDQLRRRLERLHEAIPHLAGRDNIRAQLKDLGEVVLLPESFARERQQVEEELRRISLALEKASRRLEEVEKKQQDIKVNRELLDQSGAIERLSQGLGEFKKGRTDRERLAGMRSGARTEAAGLLKNIRPDLSLEEVESLRRVLSRKRTIRHLASRREALLQEAGRAAKEHDQAVRELAAAEEALAELPPARSREELMSLCKLARRMGDIDDELNGRTREIEEERRECAAGLARLHIWQGGLAELTELPLPMAESVKRFEALFRDIEERRSRLGADMKILADELLATEEEIRKIEYTGEVPTEADLKEARRRRDERWQLIRSFWLGEDEDDQADSREDLAGDYDEQLKRADLLADRLRREADRVAAMAGLRAGREKRQNSLEELACEEKTLQDRIKDLSASWENIWRPCAITPLSPAEMLSWMQDITTLRYRAGEILKKERELGEKRSQREQVRNRLVMELGKLGREKSFAGAELAPVLLFCETILEEMALQETRRQRLGERIREAARKGETARLASNEARGALDRWREEWRKAVTGLARSSELAPVEALDLLDSLESCFAKVKEADDFGKRIKGIDRDAGDFRAEVAGLVDLLAPVLAPLPPEQQVRDLQKMLETSRQNRTLLASYEEETGRLREEIAAGRDTVSALEKQRAKLVDRAGCREPGELDEAIRRSAEAVRLREKLSDIEAALARTAAGVPPEELAGQAAAEDADELPARIRQLAKTLDEELMPRIKEISQAVGEEKKELQAMDGRAAAAEKEEAKEEVLARIGNLADRYVRLKLAAKVLQQEIERYRAENQDPILEIASRRFVTLTLNSFTGLRTDVDDKGQPVLVGLRDNGLRVTVEGMSSGSRDQLYLALRLATLEWRLASGEPMPFIVDDILINFDDDRTRATLNLLAELAGKTQIILFTHHRQIVAEAARAGGGRTIHVHEL